MNKKGELTQMQIVTFSLSIFGFLIVMTAIFSNLDLLGFTEDASCELSVLTRATSFEALKDELPLKCDTKKICLTGDKSEKCQESFAGEKKVQVVKLKNKAKEDKYTIEKTLADEMYKCWDTFGEGRLDIFGNLDEELGSDDTKVTCVICSRVAIDKNAEKIVKKEELDLGEFLRKEKVGNTGLTYLQYFSDKSVNNYPNLNAWDSTIEEIKEDSFNPIENNKDEVAIVFTQIKTAGLDAKIGNLATIGVFVAGTSFVLGAKSGILFVGKKFVKRVILSPWVLGLGVVEGTIKVAQVAVNTYEGRNAAAGYCGDFVSSSEKAREGCSIVQVVPYDFREINNLCGGGIKGNP